MPGAQPFTFEFGPWVPDLANVAVQMQYQFGAASVPCADALNVYYADGCYRSLPAAVNVTSLEQLPSPPLGAFTGIDPSGNAVQIVGTASNLYAQISGTLGFQPISNEPFSAQEWAFAQFGASVFGLDGSAAGGVVDSMIVYELDAPTFGYAGQIFFSGSIASNVLTVATIAFGYPANEFQVGTVITGPDVTPGTTILSLGSGTGGTGTYNLSTTPNVTSADLYANIPPTGNVIATVGQFLMVGDVGLNYGTNPYTLGTGNGVLTTFTGTIPNGPFRAKTIDVSYSLASNTTDNGNGSFTPNAYVASGTVNYATGAISVTFTSPVPNGTAVLVTYTQAFPERVWWSAIGLPQFWPAPLTNAALAFQSGYEDLESDLGPVMNVFGYPLYAIIFQRSGITRAIYQGGNVVFAFGTYEWKQGLIVRGAAVQVGPNVYFLSDQGFFYTDGANVYPIGTAPDNSAGIDKWFWSNVNYAAIGQIRGAYDATLRNIFFSIPTGTNTLPDTLLIFNVLSQRWTRAQIATTIIWSDTDGTRHRLGLFGQLISGGGYPSQLLTGATLTGYLESCDILFTDGNTRTTTGARPNINCTDTPLVTLGNRNTLKAPVTYSLAVAPDAFGAGFAPFLAQGLYTRARVTSGAAQAIHGATLQMVPGGAI